MISRVFLVCLILDTWYLKTTQKHFYRYLCNELSAGCLSIVLPYFIQYTVHDALMQKYLIGKFTCPFKIHDLFLAYTNIWNIDFVKDWQTCLAQDIPFLFGKV